MKHYKLLAVLCTAAALMLTGCGEKEPDFTKEAELPYGATMRSDKNSYAVPMTYDRRFLDEAQVAATADILAAIQNQDADLYLQSTPSYYADYQMEVYECEEYPELLGHFHDYIAESSGEDFQFKMVLINDISDNRNAGGLSDAFTLLKELYDGEGSFEDSIVNAWDLTVEWDLTYDNAAKYAVIEEEHVYLFQTADGYFCVM